MNSPDSYPKESAPEVSPPIPLEERFFQNVDISFLVFFRIYLGAMILFYVWKYLEILPGGETLLEHNFVHPKFHFSYPGFEWVQAWPGIGMTIHFLVIAISALFVLLGVAYRFSIVVLWASFTYVFLIDAAYYQNHYYLISLILFLMMFMPAHRAFSFDAYRHPEIRSNSIPVWTLWILRLQIGIPYFYGGLAKINWDWLNGEPVRTWFLDPQYKKIPDWLKTEEFVQFVSYAGLSFDLLIVPFLLWKRTRLFAYASCVVFHLTNSQLFTIGVFPWFMIGATLIFFEPDWPRRLLSRFNRAQLAEPITGRDATRYPRLTMALLALFAAIQVLAPFRCHLYPGVTAWTTKGDRFAWRMMLWDKYGRMKIHAKQPEIGWEKNIAGPTHLNQFQRIQMMRFPFMVKDYCRFVARQLEEDTGFKNVEVYATVEVSLNGRPRQHLIDPHVDLASLPKSRFGPTPWILPLKETNSDSHSSNASTKQK